MPPRLLLRQGNDIAHVTDLAEAVYGPGHQLTDKAYVEWKYLKNPFGALTVVYEDDGQIVAFTGYMTFPMKIGSRTLPCAIGSDSMVHPRHRRKGIFVAMLRYAEEKSDFNISMTYGTQSIRSPTARGLAKHDQSVRIGDILVLKKYLLPLSAARRMWVSAAITLQSLAEYIGALVELAALTLPAVFTMLQEGLHKPTISSAGEGIRVRPISPFIFGDEFDRLWHEVEGSLSIAIVRSRQYLNWRYSNPRVSYIGLRADENEQLRGYCVLTYTYELGLKKAWVVDLLATTADVAFVLVQHAMQIAKRDRAHVFLMWNNKVYQGFAKRIGLRRSFWKLALIVRRNTPEVPEGFVRDFSKWYLAIGDTSDQL
jgi:GNAT superfamily N-acetyltransferase